MKGTDPKKLTKDELIKSLKQEGVEVPNNATRLQLLSIYLKNQKSKIESSNKNPKQRQTSPVPQNIFETHISRNSSRSSRSQTPTPITKKLEFKVKYKIASHITSMLSVVFFVFGLLSSPLFFIFSGIFCTAWYFIRVANANSIVQQSNILQQHVETLLYKRGSISMDELKRRFVIDPSILSYLKKKLIKASKIEVTQKNKIEIWCIK